MTLSCYRTRTQVFTTNLRGDVIGHIHGSGPGDLNTRASGENENNAKTTRTAGITSTSADGVSDTEESAAISNGASVCVLPETDVTIVI